MTRLKSIFKFKLTFMHINKFSYLARIRELLSDKRYLFSAISIVHLFSLLLLGYLTYIFYISPFIIFCMLCNYCLFVVTTKFLSDKIELNKNTNFCNRDYILVISFCLTLIIFTYFHKYLAHLYCYNNSCDLDKAKIYFIGMLVRGLYMVYLIFITNHLVKSIKTRSLKQFIVFFIPILFIIILLKNDIFSKEIAIIGTETKLSLEYTLKTRPHILVEILTFVLLLYGFIEIFLYMPDPAKDNLKELDVENYNFLELNSIANRRISKGVIVITLYLLSITCLTHLGVGLIMLFLLATLKIGRKGYLKESNNTKFNNILSKLSHYLYNAFSYIMFVGFNLYLSWLNLEFIKLLYTGETLTKLLDINYSDILNLNISTIITVLLLSDFNVISSMADRERSTPSRSSVTTEPVEQESNRAVDEGSSSQQLEMIEVSHNIPENYDHRLIRNVNLRDRDPRLPDWFYNRLGISARNYTGRIVHWPEISVREQAIIAHTRLVENNHVLGDRHTSDVLESVFREQQHFQWMTDTNSVWVWYRCSWGECIYLVSTPGCSNVSAVYIAKIHDPTNLAERIPLGQNITFQPFARNVASALEKLVGVDGYMYDRQIPTQYKPAILRILYYRDFPSFIRLGGYGQGQSQYIDRDLYLGCFESKILTREMLHTLRNAP